MTTQTQYRRKLIEVDLPLDDINRESAREKSIRHGHPSTLHLWWARRPLAACRAVIFGSMVDDPSGCPDEFPDEETQHKERERLHGIIKRLVKWKNTDESRPDVKALMAEARYEIARSVARTRGEIAPTDPVEVLRYLNDRALPIYDPFAGGGSIPLEAQRLGLRAVASDLNPVSVLINKALIEIPPKFRNRPPINPDADSMGMTVGKGRNSRRVPWRGAAGLADDVRYYGRWMREEAYKRIGHLYPQVELADGANATVIAWLWARTVPCPNPVCGFAMPLMATFQLSKKRGNEHWIKPIVDRERNRITFVVQNHNAGVPERGTANGNGATCLGCGGVVKLPYVREQGRAGNMGEQMTAIVAEGNRKRLFLSPSEIHVKPAQEATPAWRPSGSLPEQARSISVQIYGFKNWHQVLTPRQLTALTTFSDLLGEVRDLIKLGEVEEECADAICTYLALALGRTANSGCSFARWQNSGDFIAGVFSGQAFPMMWDFAESNPFCTATQNWIAQTNWIAKVIERLPGDADVGAVYQADASTTVHAKDGPVIVTDPPYYGQIHFADSSDFFYVWLRSALRGIYPDLFKGILTPKNEEIIENRFRFEDPRQRFEALLGRTLGLIRERCSGEFPSSLFYAYKQQDEQREGRASTGWEAMLNAIVSAGFQIVGTWPMRTERSARSNALGTNALASSVVLVCRPRPDDAPVATRRLFLDALERELPEALDKLTRKGHIAPTDLAQAAIGPGMQIYSRYSRVETISGEPVPVREALAAINRAIADYDERQEGDFDSKSRFCLDWLKQHGYGEGQYGEAETLARAKNVAIGTLQNLDRLVVAEGGRVKLLPLDEFGDSRQLTLGDGTAWEGCFRMAYHLNHEEGDGTEGAARVARHMRNVESVERLARILYNHYDRKEDARNAVIFNNLVISWQDILTRMQVSEQGDFLRS